VMYQDW